MQNLGEKTGRNSSRSDGSCSVCCRRSKSVSISSLSRKKLLIMGGNFTHCKVVDAAKEMGVETYVVDYRETSPAKKIADHAYQIDVTDIDQLEDLCKRVGIDGVISGWIDFVQPYYQHLCDRLNFPCYTTKTQLDRLAKKKGFKECCIDYGIGTPTRIKVEDIEDPLPFKIIVKPSNSRGSKGSSICAFKEEVFKAINIAKVESFDGECVIEKYIENKDAFCATYLFVNGEAYLEQLSDVYFGDKNVGLERVAVAYRSPSVRSEEYIRKEAGRLIHMLKSLRVKNGPFVAQGFFTDDDILYFDPSRRFAGGEYERALKRLTGIDIARAMIIFALTGEFPIGEDVIDTDSYLLNGKTAIRLQINVCAGHVAREEGFDAIQEMQEVECVARYHAPGDVIEATGNTLQRYAQIVLVADETEQLKIAIKRIYDKIRVFDESDKNMIISLFDPEKL